MPPKGGIRHAAKPQFIKAYANIRGQTPPFGGVVQF